MDLYFSYLAILRKVANHAALLQSTAGTSKKQVYMQSCKLFKKNIRATVSYSLYITHLFFQEKYVSAICQKVFQKFPDFVQRCKDEAFEALSDPTYSGKMKVRHRNKGSATCSLQAVLVYVNMFIFRFRFCRSCLNIICKREIKCLFFLSQPR